jgi:hypothetical protein
MATGVLLSRRNQPFRRMVASFLQTNGRSVIFSCALRGIVVAQGSLHDFSIPWRNRARLNLSHGHLMH